MNTYSIKKHSATIALTVLVLTTVISWAMNRGDNPPDSASNVIVAATMVLSFLKAGVIIAIFMEVLSAPLVLKLVMSVWLGITFVALTVVLVSS